MSLFKSKVVLTEEEEKVRQVVEKMLENEETLIEIDPSNMSFLLSNEKFGFYVDIDSNGIKISNHTFARDIRLESKKIDLLKDMATKEASKRRGEKKVIIFKNGIDLLNNIITKLC